MNAILPAGHVWMCPPRDLDNIQAVPESEQVTRQTLGWLHASPPPLPAVHDEKKYPCGCSASGPGPLPDYCPDHPMQRLLDEANAGFPPAAPHGKRKK